MKDSSFFNESTEQSQIKSEIVAKYFWAWAKVIMPRARSSKIAYIDLFAGPGRYKDGAMSTPLLILEQAIQDPKMRGMLITVFNDVNSTHTQSLQNAIDLLPNVRELKHRPLVCNEEVGEDIVRMFEGMRLIPTLFFVDPWGYKGLSLGLIASVLKDWGCDCIFFLNYNRINMGLHNEAVRGHMDALFGKERADGLREQLRLMEPYERELTIVEAIGQALKQMGGEYVLPFRFRNDHGSRTSHYLIFVSKNAVGYKIMKDIMAKASSSQHQGEVLFEYSPATRNQPLLFGYLRPIADLADMLLADFAGQTISTERIYERHNIGKPYVESDYKEVLRTLEAEGKIVTEPPARQRRKLKGKVTFGNNVKVTFPPKGDR